MASNLHRWWVDQPNESYWLEVTGRSDPGQNLKAPQANETGGDFWSYALVQEVQARDVVFHYDRPSHSIIAVSQGTGDHWEDQIIWAARGTYAREAGIEPHTRPGWYAGLTQFRSLEHPVSLAQIRERTSEIQEGLSMLEAEVGKPLYFPFESGRTRPIRPLQAYLFKLPRFFVETFPGLSQTVRRGAVVQPASVKEALGSEYRPADEDLSVGEFDPMEVDPAVVERGTRGHAKAQNELARYLEAKGVSPRSPGANDPNFDLAWSARGEVWVAEVKSITDRNEERQLRMGLGQVLQYRHQMSSQTRQSVRAVLALERRPPSDWLDLCASLGVRVVWEGGYAALGL